MYVIAGHLQPLNIFIVYRTIFSTKEEAQTFLKDELGAYTFFEVKTMAQVCEHATIYKDNLLLVPMAPAKHEGDKG